MFGPVPVSHVGKQETIRGFVFERVELVKGRGTGRPSKERKELRGGRGREFLKGGFISFMGLVRHNIG